VLCALLCTSCAQQSNKAATFATPDEAVQALVTAFDKNDVAAASKILGPHSDELLDSGDAVADKNDRAWFVSAYTYQVPSRGRRQRPQDAHRWCQRLARPRAARAARRSLGRGTAQRVPTK
jgi:hypothetical protein